MEGLMHVCLLWGKRKCSQEAAHWRKSFELKDAESIPLQPVGKDLEKLDEICRKCESRLFQVHKEQCPVCDSEDVEAIGGSSHLRCYKPTYGYKCLKCGEVFRLLKKS